MEITKGDHVIYNGRKAKVAEVIDGMVRLRYTEPATDIGDRKTGAWVKVGVLRDVDKIAPREERQQA